MSKEKTPPQATTQNQPSALGPGPGGAAPGEAAPAAAGLLGRQLGDPRQSLEQLKGKLGTAFKRAGLHLLAAIAAFVIAEGNSPVEQFFFFYLGVICLLPRGFSPRRNSYIFPLASSLAQLVLLLLLGHPLPLSVFLAGAQSWAQRAVIRRFHLGLDWLPAPFLLGFFVQATRGHVVPLGFFGVTFLCGLGAYYAARALDARKRARLQAKALADSSSPYAHFYASAAELEEKAQALPAEMQAQLADIARYGRNILGCMAQDPAHAQPGARFLGRYLPAGHKIVDDYIRLGKEGREHQDIEAVLGRVDEILTRLAQAFKQEHGSLLRNDAMQLGAELQVLDKLLKMDGR